MRLDGSTFEEDGYAVLDSVLSVLEVEGLRRVVGDRLNAWPKAALRRRELAYGVRGLLRIVPELRRLDEHPAIRSVVDTVVAGAVLVRGILFDKSTDVNWGVPWHQDLTIPVRERHEVAGFEPWSVKRDVPHVQPPAWFLERMLTIRLHLDEAAADSGPLRVLPGTHRAGKLSDRERGQREAEVEPVTCTTNPGGVVLISPLTMHSSPRSQSARSRRVLHLEFAAEPLPAPLEWYEALD